MCLPESSQSFLYILPQEGYLWDPLTLALDESPSLVINNYTLVMKSVYQGEIFPCLPVTSIMVHSDAPTGSFPSVRIETRERKIRNKIIGIWEKQLLVISVQDIGLSWAGWACLLMAPTTGSLDVLQRIFICNQKISVAPVLLFLCSGTEI